MGPRLSTGMIRGAPPPAQPVSPASIITSILAPLGAPDVFEECMAYYGHLISVKKRPGDEEVRVDKLLDAQHEAMMQRLRQNV